MTPHCLAQTKPGHCPMKTSDFDYDLPQELIAQTPVEPRDHSRLMLLDRETGQIDHKMFYELPDIAKRRGPARVQ